MPVARVDVQARKLVVVAVAVNGIHQIVSEAIGLPGDIRHGVVLQVLQRNRVQPAGRDHVVGKRRALHARA